MAFVKANMTLVVCAIVALVVLGFCVWPTLSWDDGLKAQMQERMNQAKVADNLILPKLEVYPGGPMLSGATVEPNIQEARKQAYREMKDQADTVAKLASSQNLMNRILEQGGPGGSDHEIPLLADRRAEDHFLPVKTQSADAFGFKMDYERQFPEWVARVKGGTPPTTAEITQLIAAANAEKTRQQNAVGALLPGTAGQQQSQLSNREQNQIKRVAVISRAAGIRCYVDEFALQRRDWFGKSTPPNETQMFEAFVDTWLQQDVVNAIATLNDSVLKQQPTEAERNVGHSPIKRLESIIIGNNASATNAGGGPGALFMGMVAASTNQPSNAMMMPTASATGVDLTRSLTGHVGGGGSDYDVALMKIVVDIDPAYENQFIDTLYRQNNGYTVINRKMHVVDPLEAASNGFLYGQTQVIRVELLVEALLFRSWTSPLMPPDIAKGNGSGGGALSPGGGPGGAMGGFPTGGGRRDGGGRGR